MEELCLAIVDCEHKTSPVDPAGEYFAVGTPAMRGNVIDYSQARRISRATFISWTRRLAPRSGDLLFAREAPVGPVVLIPDAGNIAPGQRTVLMRPNPAIADSRFLYYLLSSPQQQGLLQAKASGSTVAHLNVADVRSFPLDLPPVLEQRAIAEVLGALDDKIAANLKLVEASIELASALFQGALRSAEWSDSTFNDLAAVSGGGTPSTRVPAYWDGDVNWATPTDVTGLRGPYLNRTGRRISEAGLNSCSSALYQPGAILMTSRATIGAFAVTQCPTAVNQGFIVVQPNNPELRWWLFHEMQSRVDEFISLANGATFLELSRGNFRKLSVRLADDSTTREFDGRVGSLHEAGRVALEENRTLSTIREALLPQLMSGKLRVRDAEKVLEGAL
jgi:type I restriction enzyme S subunit